MSKYQNLWDTLRGQTAASVKLTFDEIETICGVPIDHSFLQYKKELLQYGYRVEKISLKDKTILFLKNE